MLMAIEQGLKTWIKGKKLYAKPNKTADENSRLPALWDKAGASIVGVNVKLCTKKQPSDKELSAAVDKWVTANRVPYEQPFP